MTGFWIQVVTAVLVGSFAAAVVVLWTRRHRPVGAVGAGDRDPAGAQDRDHDPRLGAGGRFQGRRADRDPWTRELNRCEQAVCRAARAADTVSSEQARRGLRRVVHRMDAELPHVRALVELGRGVGGGSARHEPGVDSVPARVHRQLAGAAGRFETVTEELARSVSDLVADADLERVQRRAAALREQFPLLPSMSRVLEPPGSTSAQTTA